MYLILVTMSALNDQCLNMRMLFVVYLSALTFTGSNQCTITTGNLCKLISIIRPYTGVGNTHIYEEPDGKFPVILLFDWFPERCSFNEIVKLLE